jgi:hypothetical protein
MIQIGLKDQQVDLCPDIFKVKVPGDYNVKTYQYLKECQ